MKRIFFTILGTWLLTNAMAQTFQGTIKPGSTANSVIVAIKPSGNYSDKPSNIQLSVAIPQTVGTRPLMNLMTNYYSSFFSTADRFGNATFGTDYIYLVNMAVPTLTTVKNYTTNTEDLVAELSFTGNVGNISNIRLVQLPNGMATGGAGSENGNYNFYTEFATGGSKTNQTTMFYTTTGGTVINSPLGFSGYSSVSAGSLAIPVKWVDFSVIKQNGNAVIRWEVANQVNTDFYEVEAGTDGQSFSTITKVLSNETRNVYTFTDVSLNKRIGQYAYYRIRQVDKDGKVGYSVIKKILLNKHQFSFGIVSNPVKGRELKINIQAFENSIGIIKIFDLNGKQVYQKNITWSEGYSEQIIQLPNLSSGSYIASLSTPTNQYQAKFIK